MEYGVWDFENDIVVTKGKLLLPEKTALNYMGSAYAVETEVGIFYQKMCKDGRFDLHLVDQNGDNVYEEDIVVVASNLKYTCIVVHFERTGEYYLIDVRGKFFLLEVSNESLLPAQYDMKLDKATGFYLIGPRYSTRWMVRAVDKRKQFTRMLDSSATGVRTLNPSFRKLFSKQNAGDYLYLTIMNSKKGRLISYLIENCLPYEEVPNIFMNDSSRNIRIPINAETLSKREMHFLLKKYSHAYAIEGIPIEKYIGSIQIGRKQKDSVKMAISEASETQFPKVQSVVGDLKLIYGYESDDEIFKKLLKRITNLFTDVSTIEYENYYDSLEFPYAEFVPYERTEERELVKKRLEYINKCLFPDKPITTIDGLSNVDFYSLYRDIYAAAKKFSKAELQVLEDRIAEITERNK